MINKKNIVLVIINIFILSNCVYSGNKYGKVIMDCKLYSDQTMKSNILSDIENNEYIVILERGNKSKVNKKKNNWYKINCFGEIGWIFGDWIEFDQEFSQVTDYDIEAKYLKWGTEDHEISIYFRFKNDNKVLIMEKSLNKDKYNEYEKYEMNYASFDGNSLLIFGDEPMTPLHEFIIKDNEVVINTYATIPIYETKKYKQGQLNFDIYLTPSIDNLRFRESPDLKGKFIRSLKKGEKLELLEKGKTEVIQGDKGTWVKVRTESGELGWCFDAYLEEVK